MKISILSPVYNEADYLDEMVSSVQGQTHQDWELLFVDDGSSDGTAGRVESYGLRDGRIQLISRDKRLGKVGAINQAYAASTGEMVVLLAGDDRLPSHSLAVRHAAISPFPMDEPAVAFFKIRTFSFTEKFDGMVLPRGSRANRSGGSITMNRALSDLLFPIDDSLVAEDIWLAYASVELAKTVVERSDVVLDYRIHEGNSNPRNRPFAEMNESMHQRHRAWPALLRCSRFRLGTDTTLKLQALWDAELLRYGGSTLRLLRANVPFMDRVALASMSSPWLFAVRTRFYKFFSGLR